MADPIVHITAGIPDSGTGNITTLGQTLLDGANATMGVTTGAAVTTDAAGTLQQYLRGLIKQFAAGVYALKVWDGTNTAAVKAASTAPLATDPALVVAISPNSVNANGQAAMAASAPVVIASNQSAVPISATSLPLPTGAMGATGGTVGLVASIAKVGVVTTDQTTHGTTDLVAADITKVGGSALALGSAATAAAVPVAAASDQRTISVAADTANIANGVTGTNLTPLFATIVASASGATTIVALTAGKKIRVLAWDLKVNAAVNFKWQSHVTPTDLTGLYYNAGQGDGVARAFNPVGYFQTIAGEALDLNLSGSVAVGGSLVYVLV